MIEGNGHPLIVLLLNVRLLVEHLAGGLRLLADESVGDEDHTNNAQRRAERAPRRLEQQHHGDHAHHHVGLTGQALAGDDAGVIPPNEERAGGRHDRQHYIDQGYVFAVGPRVP